MTTELEYLSQNLYCLRSELLHPVILVQGGYKLLVDKVPETAIEILSQTGSISENLLSEIQSFPKNEIDLQSPGNAVMQLQSLAIKWEKDTIAIILLASKIETIIAYSENLDLNKILEIISSGLQKFQGYVQRIQMIQAEHLTQDYGFAKILKYRYLIAAD